MNYFTVGSKHLQAAVIYPPRPVGGEYYQNGLTVKETEAQRG